MRPSSLPAAESAIAVPGHGGVATRIYGRRRRGGGMPLVLHFHGGNFASGGLDCGAALARLLESAGAVVVSLAYPLAPAHPFPQAVETGYAALQWLHRQRGKLAGAGARLFVAGEEAGGCLAAAVALVARDQAHPPLAGQILVAPMLDPCTGTASLREAVGMATQCRWAEGWQQYLRSPMDAEHPYAVPSRTLRLAGLPPTLVLTGEDDPMHDEALAYAARLRAGGIAVTANVLPVTGWPESLDGATRRECSCSAAVEEHFRAFFSAGAPPAGAPPPAAAPA